MGWDFTQGASKNDIIEELIKPWGNEKFSMRIIKHTCVGQTLWTIQEHVDLAKNETVQFIGCYLLKGDRNYGWGYKSMDESCGPYYFNCPLNYLDAVPVQNQEWRDKVREYHADKRAKTNRVLVVGRTYRLLNRSIPAVKLVSLKPLHGVYDSRRYKVSKSYLGEEIPETETVGV